MDLVSRTSAGIEAASSNQREGPDVRLRPPRAFYGKEKVIRNFDIVHANLHLIAPKLRYRLPELPAEALSLDFNYFMDAWILEENTRKHDWVILVSTADQLIRISRYASEHARQQDMQDNERLSRVFHGSGLIQVCSVNSYAQMQSIELYENQMFDIVFEDDRELFTINDTKVADKIYRTIKSLHSDIEKVKRENQTTKSCQSYKHSESVRLSAPLQMSSQTRR